MAADEKNELIEKILKAQLGEYVSWTPPDAVPVLSPKYQAEMLALRVKVGSFLSKQRLILNDQDGDDLQVGYDADGRALTDELKSHWDEVRISAPVTRNETVIVAAGLGKPSFIADYDYWLRMEWIELKEAVWLAVGLDPRQDWSEKLTYVSPKRPGHRTELAHVQGVLDQLSRFLSTVDARTKKFRGPELLGWILATGFPAHPGFVEMLRLKSGRSDHKASPVKEVIQSRSISTKEDPRAVKAVARIITAIAIEEYGYIPDAKRSPIPVEIVSIMDRLGLQGSAETVLKYLKIGASELPPGWNGSDN